MGLIDVWACIKDLLAVWKAVQELLAILFGDEARVQADDASPVALVADQPAKSLLEFNDGIGQGIFHESISPVGLDSFCSGLDDGLSGNFKWQLDDDDTAQSFSGNIHPFPKRICAEQNEYYRCF